MRIVVASACEFPDGIGGTPRFVQMQAKGLVRLGNEVTVAVTCGTWSGDNAIQVDGYEVKRFNRRASDLRGLRRKLAALPTHARFFAYLFGTVLRRRCSVLVLNGPVLDFVIIAPLARLRGIETQYVQADMLPSTRNMSLAMRAKKLLSWTADVFLARISSKLILLGTNVLQDYYKRVAPRTQQVRVCAPTDTQVFGRGDGEAARARFGVGGRRLILYCGTVDALEGCHVLLEAMVGVHQRVPESVLVLAGVIWPHDRALDDPLDFPAMVRDLGLEDCVMFTGHLPAEDVIDLLAAADVLVMPKIDHLLNRVAMPIKIAEYMAAGRPVVSSRICELDQCLAEGKDIVFCEPGDASGLADSISRVLSDPNLSDKLASSARLAASRIFDCTALARRMLSMPETSEEAVGARTVAG